MDMKNNMNQFSNPISSTNPQTPSSIPDIILTADDGSDRALQRMLGTTVTVVEFHSISVKFRHVFTCQCE